MALTQRLDLRQTQSLVMTPQLQQAIKLLQLSNLELAEFVDREIEQNPLLEATEHRQPWSNEDLEFVIEMTDVETDEDIALALGRTLYALWAIQHRIKSGDLVLDEARKREAQAARTRREERAYTFIGDDVPPGWWD